MSTPSPAKRARKSVGSVAHLRNPGLVSDEAVARYIEEHKGLVICNTVGSVVFSPVTQDPQHPVGTQCIEHLLRKAGPSLQGLYDHHGFGAPMSVRLKNGPKILIVNRGRANMPGCKRPDDVLFWPHIVASAMANVTGIAMDVTNINVTNRQAISYTGRALDLRAANQFLSAQRSDSINHVSYSLRVGDEVVAVLLHDTGTIVMCGTRDISVMEQALKELLACLAHFAGPPTEPVNPRRYREFFGTRE